MKCWVSPRTVEDHPRNGFTKTGVTFRGKLTGFNFGYSPLSSRLVVTSGTAVRSASSAPASHGRTASCAGRPLRHPESGLQLALRLDPERAAALAGFDTLCLAVGTSSDLDAVLS